MSAVLVQEHVQAARDMFVAAPVRVYVESCCGTAEGNGCHKLLDTYFGWRLLVFA